MHFCTPGLLFFKLVHILKIIILYTQRNNYEIYFIKPICTFSSYLRFSLIHDILWKISYLHPVVLEYNDETR